MARRKGSLGSLIASYKLKYKYQKKRYDPSQQHDILKVIERLEGYKRYQKQIKQEKETQKKKNFRKLLKKVKRESYKKAYSIKPVNNPYVYMYTRHNIVPDPRLMTSYQSKNIYSMYEFRHLKLPKSGYNIMAGHAWGGLIKAWTGFKIAKREGNKERMRLYGSATQAFVNMLEIPMMPHFPELGLPALSLRERRKD
jgi:hypothetical protein